MSRKSTVERGDPVTQDMSRRDIAKALGVNRRFLWECVQIASIPEAEFEAALATKTKPTTERLVNMVRDRTTLRRCPNCGHVLRRAQRELEGGR